MSVREAQYEGEVPKCKSETTPMSGGPGVRPVGVQDGNEQVRGTFGVMVDGLLRRNGIAGLSTAIAVAIKPREVRRGDVDTETVAGLEAIGGGPHVDLEAVDASGLQQFGRTLQISVAGPQHSVLQLNGTPVGEYIRQPR